MEKTKILTIVILILLILSAIDFGLAILYNHTPIEYYLPLIAFCTFVNSVVDAINNIRDEIRDLKNNITESNL